MVYFIRRSIALYLGVALGLAACSIVKGTQSKLNEKTSASEKVPSGNVIRFVETPKGMAPFTANVRAIFAPQDSEIQSKCAGLSDATLQSACLQDAVDFANQAALGSGTPLNAHYEWDFGDAGSSYNQLEGFNAAHSYAQAGTYRIRLKITNVEGLSQTVESQVIVDADTRKVIYVSANGDDAKDGSSEANAVKSSTRALALLGNNTKLLFKRGDTFTLASGINIPFSNVLIDAYGSGEAPILFLTVTTSYANIITPSTSAHNIVIQNLTFDTDQPAQAGVAPYINANSIKGNGFNLTVRHCRFLNVDSGVLGNGKPTGVLFQDNEAPLVTGLRAYMFWMEGTDLVLLGNSCANVTRGHCTRGHASRVLIAKNDFSNIARPTEDASDYAYETIRPETGAYVFVSDNETHFGSSYMGPLDALNADGTPVGNPVDRLRYIVFQNNKMEDSIIRMRAGVEHAVLRNNVIKISAAKTGMMAGLNLMGHSSVLNRESTDFEIVNNTVYSLASSGGFLWTGTPPGGGSAVTPHVRIKNNLFVGPNLSTAGQAGAMMIFSSDLSGFDEISHNLWSLPAAFSERTMYLWPTWYNVSGLINQAEWSATSPVNNDYFLEVNLSNSYQIKVGDDWVGSSLPW